MASLPPPPLIPPAAAQTCRSCLSSEFAVISALLAVISTSFEIKALVVVKSSAIATDTPIAANPIVPPADSSLTSFLFSALTFKSLTFNAEPVSIKAEVVPSLLVPLMLDLPVF